MGDTTELSLCTMCATMLGDLTHGSSKGYLRQTGLAVYPEVGPKSTTAEPFPGKQGFWLQSSALSLTQT